MANEDYVSYEVAKRLKAAGFDWPCGHYYCAFDNETDVRFWSVHPEQSQNAFRSPEGKVIVDAPTLWQAQKWVREGLMLHVGICPAIPFNRWRSYIDDLNQSINPTNGELVTRWDEDMQAKVDKLIYDSYEDALSAGISRALELIDAR